MLKYDKSYSEYNNGPSDDYPNGSAVNATSEDNIDGTPYVAGFFNDVIGFFQAAFYEVFGRSAQVSGVSENANKSDVWNAIKKFVGDSVEAARLALQSAIDTAKGALQGAIDAINDLIPAQANSENQLADKDFVNSSIATNTANFIGDFDSLEALESQLEIPVTNNDYAFVKTVDSAGNNIYNRYKYNAQEGKWLFEYALNNTGFTAEQAAAINSGATRTLMDKLKKLPDDSVGMPVATIITSVAEKAPDGYLLCDGGIYAQSQYPALYAVIGDKYNRDGTSEGFFCVPDLRELVLVGVGQNTFHSIAGHDVFEVGQFKDDQLQNHRHYRWNGNYNGWNRAVSLGENFTFSQESTEVNNGMPTGRIYDTEVRKGTTTRGKSFGVNYFIKAV